MRGSCPVLLLLLLVLPAALQQDNFDPLQRYPNMPADYFPQAFATPESNHLQYFQDADDHNEWKWETTQVDRRMLSSLCCASACMVGFLKGMSPRAIVCRRTFNVSTWQRSSTSRARFLIIPMRQAAMKTSAST